MDIMGLQDAITQLNKTTIPELLNGLTEILKLVHNELEHLDGATLTVTLNFPKKVNKDVPSG